MKSLMQDKSYAFAIRIVKLSKLLYKNKEFVLSKQLLRSGTAVGALLREAEFVQSTADFINKQSIALKEANETIYWLDLLHDTDYLESKLFESIMADCKELVAMLVSSIKKLKSEN
ncbi:MAG: four helix bundle protein [Prolixibacteraceae bacterium]